MKIILKKTFQKLNVPLLLIMIFIVITGNVLAQGQVKINGLIKDASNGEAIPGANVMVEGTTIGTTSDMTGKFTIEVPSGQSIVIISYIGYQTQKVNVQNRDYVEVSLEVQAAQLEELVVVGYGYQKKSDLTGSIVSVSSKDFESRSLTSLDQGLQGRVAGMQVTQASGEPGGAVSLRVRGSGSILASSEPLYVIDGFPINSSDETANPGSAMEYRGVGTNALAALNPGDIESVEILKDASATSIYGSRGANGVVLITTKKGKQGKLAVDFDSYYGWQSVTKTVDLLNGKEFAELSNEYFASIAAPGTTPSLAYNNPDSIGNGTDWQKQIFRTAPVQNYQISINGGNDKTLYSISGSYFKQDGIVIGSSYWRGSLRSNVEQTVSSKIKVGLNLTGSRTDADRVKSYGDDGVIVAAMTYNPTVPVFTSAGDYSVMKEVNGVATNQISNPLAYAKTALDNNVTNRVIANSYLNYNIVKGLTLRITAGTDISNAERNRYLPLTTFNGNQKKGAATLDASSSYSWLNENTLTYDNTFGKHHLTVLGGFTQQAGAYKYHQVSTENFISDIFTTNNIGLGQKVNVPLSGYGDWALQSYLARINYVYADKILLTLTGRADGSSKFGPNNKWGYFPSAALGYRLSKENFMQSVAFVNELKLRASIGQTGNSNIPSYQSIAQLTNMPYIFNNQIVTGIGPNSLANPDLKWETTTQKNFGIDLGMLENRITFNFDYYIKNTKDLLLKTQFPAQIGFESGIMNLGSLESKGYELALSSYIFNRTFKWNVSGTFSVNEIEVTDLGGKKQVASINDKLYGGFAVDPSQILINEPLGLFWGYVAKGVFKDQADVDAWKVQPTAKPGDVKYLDFNNDGKITGADMTTIGNPNPDFIWSINNTFSYANLDLSILWNGVSGNDIFNVNLIDKLRVGIASNQVAAAKNRWRQPGDVTDVPRVNSNNVGWQSTRHIEDGSFARLQSVTLGYNFKNINKFGISRAKVYLTGQNLITITKYSGYDPEVNSLGKDILNLGVDLGAYPKARTIMVGVSLGF